MDLAAFLDGRRPPTPSFIEKYAKFTTEYFQDPVQPAEAYTALLRGRTINQHQLLSNYSFCPKERPMPADSDSSSDEEELYDSPTKQMGAAGAVEADGDGEGEDGDSLRDRMQMMKGRRSQTRATSNAHMRQRDANVPTGLLARDPHTSPERAKTSRDERIKQKTQE